MDSDRIEARLLRSDRRLRVRLVLPGLVMVVGLAALAGAGSASATTKSALFTSHRVSAKLALPAHARPGTAVLGKLDPGVVAAATLVIPLPDGRVITVTQRHVARDKASGTMTWTGRVTGSPGDLVVLAKRKGTVAGFVRSGQRTFELHATSAGQSLLFEVAEPHLSADDAVQVPVTPDSARSKVGLESVGRLAASSSPVFQDLLVVYTTASMSRMGQATLESLIIAAVESTNASYRDSGVNLTLSLVGMRPVALMEGPSMQSTLNSLRQDPEVSLLRDQRGADIVLLVSENNDWGGMAYIMPSDGPEFAPMAFGVVNSASVSSRTFAHEIGHIQGLAHDRETGGPAGAYPYGRGYRRCAADSSSFFDIMAYSCLVGPNNGLATFASPSIYYQGYPTGVAYELDPANAADAVSALGDTAATVASFRATVAIPPNPPGGLTASPVSGRQVNLVWTHSGTTASGFRIERTRDGVNYVEIASVGAASRSHEDLTAAPDTTYSYRVAAYNSAGLSAYSNLSTVTTPEVPRTPSGLTATGIMAGQVTLKWVDNASSETDFRIERSFDGVHFTEIASVGANVQSHTDHAVSPSTTYHYRVLASGSAGPSDYSNVATITTPALPIAPSALAVTEVSTGHVSLEWVDNADNELGFRIERSINGAAFTEIAAAALDARSHTDRTVASDTTYYYRVAAYNAGGVSAYSNRVTIRTPVAPPQLPVAFSVTNNRQKTALVRFTPSPGAPVANYELLREVYKKKQWRYPSTLFSIQAYGPYSSIDASGKGTFRYSIRACNAVGCTAYSAPVTVKVTK